MVMEYSFNSGDFYSKSKRKARFNFPGSTGAGLNLSRLTNIDSAYLIITNFANPDMVGHTGNIEATVRAIEAVDKCIGRIFEECKKNGYSLILTSDHGNAENMFDEKKNMACTTHSLNLVPFTICEKINYSVKTGKLADIAPTVLKLLGLKIPTVMKGKPLIK